jgi:hypothetical protein
VPNFGGPEKKKEEAYGTWYSQAVTHPSTNQARRCLTSVIGRELVLSTWYGRKRKGISVTEYHSGDYQGYYYEIGNISTPLSGSQNVRVLGAELQVYLS